MSDLTATVRRCLLGVVVAATTAVVSVSASAADISGAGATFPYPIYAKWAESYKAATGVGLNYQSIGSGGGIKQIQASTVTFGASDKPLEPAELKKSNLVQFPMIIGGVVPVVHVKGIEAGALTLDGPTLAEIDAGERRPVDDDVAGLDAVEVHDRHDAAHDHRELHETVLVEFLALEGRIGRAKGHGPGFDLLDAAARADRLIVQADAGVLLIGVRPFGVDRIGERGARAGNIGGGCDRPRQGETRKGRRQGSY